MLGFQEGGKPEDPEKNPWSKARTNSKLNPHDYSTRPELNPGHFGARHVLSPTSSLLHMDMQFTLLL